MAREGIERRLAAILSADVVGYSRLMAGDETGTLGRLKGLRGEIIDPIIAEHNGRIVKLMGDGALVEFASVVDAVECAVAAQKAVAEHQADVPEALRIALRIGINLGDVIVEGDDIYGDGVNVAARIEALAPPGGICISRAARDQVRDKLDLALEDMGEIEVKNIPRAIRVFRVPLEPAEANGGERPAAADPALAARDKPSIAVLPFENMSGDPDQDFFADGIAEDIISALSRFHWFFVISRNSSFAYKGKTADVKQTARDLGVQYVLEGSVRKAGTRVRITAQLIDAVEDRHVWAEHYDRELEDIFAVQDEVTQSIVGAVAPEYMAAEMQRTRRKETPRLDAWELAVRAHWHIAQFTREGNDEAREMLLKAVQLDPDSTFGLADLAFVYLRDGIFGWSENFDQVMAEAEQAALKAVAVNNRDAFAYALLGAVNLYSDRHDAAVRRFEQAIELNPNDAHGHALLGRTLIYLGESDAGRGHVDQALRLSPRDPMWSDPLKVVQIC